MSDTMTDEQRAEHAAQDETEEKLRHRWWVDITSPQRKVILKRSIRQVLYGQQS